MTGIPLLIAAQCLGVLSECGIVEYRQAGRKGFLLKRLSHLRMKSAVSRLLRRVEKDAAGAGSPGRSVKHRIMISEMNRYALMAVMCMVKEKIPQCRRFGG